MAINTLKRKDEKDLIIFPDRINFGAVEKGGIFQTKLILRNNQDMLQRILIKPPIHNSHISVLKFEGPIAPGMSKVENFLFAILFLRLQKI